MDSSTTITPVLALANSKKSPSLSIKLDECQSNHSTVTRKPTLAFRDVHLKHQSSKGYLKPKTSKNFIAANKEKVRGGLLDYARSIKDASMAVSDKLKWKLIRDGGR